MPLKLVSVLNKISIVGTPKQDSIAYRMVGESITVGFNASYLIDALARIDGDEVFLEFNEELDPCVLKPVDSENFVGVVMPLRL